MVLSEAAYTAARDGDFQGVVVALDTGTLVNDRTASEGFPDETMLIIAIFGNHYDIVRFLLERGADPNMSDNERLDSRPLMVAQDERAIDLLVAYGADVDYATRPRGRNGEPVDGGRTALMIHAVRPRTDCVRALLRHGASFSLPDDHGQTVLEQTQQMFIWSLDDPSREPETWKEIVDLLTAVEASGSWKRYVREPVVQLLCLRYLCLAGRATPPPNLARCFGSPPIANADKARTRSRRRASSAARTPLPDEVFEHILTFWNFAGTSIEA